MSNFVLIVDDEAPARSKLASFLSKTSKDLMVREVSSAEDTKPWLSKADLIFLDIQMPGKDAFELIAEVGIETFPPIIFTTAYHEYALQAFEIHAIDYLLKPYTFDRFKVAFERALINTQHDHATKKMLAEFMGELSRHQFPRQIWVRQGSKLIPLQLTNVTHVESDGNYVQVYANGGRFLLRESLKKMEEKLDPQQFVRVHRSTIINRNHLREVRPRSHGDLLGKLSMGKEIVISRRYRDRLLDT